MLGNQPLRLFLQNGFWESPSPSSTLHRHTYSEAHLVQKGKLRYQVDQRIIEAVPGDLFVIPPHIFHKFADSEPETAGCAFQMSLPVKKFCMHHVPVELLTLLLHEIAHWTQTGDSLRLSGYLTVLCAEIYGDMHHFSQPIQDRAFLIHEYFANNYNRPLTLQEFSAQLNLSEKQTERLILQHTGRTFRQELMFRRVQAARQLIASGLSYSEVAERVGYSSYSGLWKALQTFPEKTTPPAQI